MFMSVHVRNTQARVQLKAAHRPLKMSFLYKYKLFLLASQAESVLTILTKILAQGANNFMVRPAGQCYLPFYFYFFNKLMVEMLPERENLCKIPAFFPILVSILIATNIWVKSFISESPLKPCLSLEKSPDHKGIWTIPWLHSKGLAIPIKFWPSVLIFQLLL